MRDHLVHFLAADCELIKPVSRLLRDLKFINREDFRAANPKKSDVLVTKLRCRKIFSVIVKDHHFEKTTPLKIVPGLCNLRLTCAKQGDEFDDLDIHKYISQELRDCPATITLCEGNVEVPDESIRVQIIEESHSSLVGGHKGVVKIYWRIRDKFHWPGRKQKIHAFIQGCEISRKNKLTRIKTKQSMAITDTLLEPFEKISIDTVGPLSMTSDGNVHILTIQDNFPKAAATVPFPDIRAATGADALLNHYIAIYRCPRVILSDKGTSFTSKLIQQLAKTLKIQRLTTFSYYFQENASLERSHQPLVDYLRAYVD